MSVLSSEQVLTTFLEMVRINSPSGDEGAMREYLIGRLNALDIPSTVDAGGNLIADIPKHQCDHDSILVLSGHMDVVPPCQDIQPVVTGEGEERVIASDNTTVLGADDKSGLAAILEAVALSLQHHLPRPALRLIFTTREEVGLAGAKELSDEALNANFAVTFDHTGRQGVIIHQAPTYIRFTIECLGKSVHAGIMPEQGVNAIVFASKVINRLHLGRINPDTTANIGFVEGGRGTNVVPDQVVLQGELRGHDPAFLEQELAYIQQVLAEEKAAFPGTDTRFEYHTEFQGYTLPADQKGVQLVQAAAEALQLNPQLIRTNGGSDNNVFVHRGLLGVVLSAGYMEPHSLKERVRLSEMTLCTRFIIQMMEQFARHAF